MNDSRSAVELIDELNTVAESATLEAKEYCETGGNRSLLETVCSLSNEPGLGGGTILWGVEERDAGIVNRYRAKGIPNVDKADSRREQMTVILHAIDSTMQDNGESMQDIVCTMQDNSVGHATCLHGIILTT